jgi:hypothetical protein
LAHGTIQASAQHQKGLLMISSQIGQNKIGDDPMGRAFPSEFGFVQPRENSGPHECRSRAETARADDVVFDAVADAQDIRRVDRGNEALCVLIDREMRFADPGNRAPSFSNSAAMAPAPGRKPYGVNMMRSGLMHRQGRRAKNRTAGDGHGLRGNDPEPLIHIKPSA